MHGYENDYVCNGTVPAFTSLSLNLNSVRRNDRGNKKLEYIFSNNA